MSNTPPAAIAQATGLVGSVLSQAQGMAQASMSAGLSAVQALADFDVVIPDVVVPDVDVPVIAVPDVGTPPNDPGNLDIVLPGLPLEPVQGALAL